MRRRIVVAQVELEAVEQKVFRHGWAGMTVGEILAEPRNVRLNAYWCSACWEEHRPADVKTAPVYPGSAVHDEAECRECHCDIADLQRALADLGRG